MQTALTTVEIPPRSTHLYSVIWLHGLGADGHDFEGIVSELNLQAADNIQFIFPNAPIQPVTINGGMEMRSWYDIIELHQDGPVDLPGIEQSCQAIGKLIQREMDKGIASENILLAGFSQGGMIALHTGLCFPKRLAGILALSTYLPTLKQVAKTGSEANQSLPILMAHGILDAVIAIEVAKNAYHGLTGLGYSVQWHDYLMGHSVCVEELEHISAFINGIFKQA
ncbi:phospholipase/carboxylesterase [Methylosoma difficile]